MLQQLLLIGARTGLILSCKSGSTSVMQALKAVGRLGHPVLPHEFLAGADRRILVMREPHDRAASAYRMYSGRISNRPRIVYCERGHDARSFEAFVLSISADFRNDPHVLPQSLSCYSSAGEPLFTEINKWDFGALAGLIGAPVGHWNAAHQHEAIWTDAAKEAFAETYADDLQLWRG